MKLKKYILSVLSFCFLTITSGFSIWNVNPEGEKSFPLNGTKGDVVAYFTDSKGNRREFTSIEGALKTAGEGTEANAANTIYVIPGKNPTIYGSCTIAENDTLCLPFKDENWSGDASSVNEFGDNSQCRSKVTLKNTLTISSGAHLYIGGQTGGASGAYEGGTYGLCASLDLDSNSDSSSGAIECYGEIKCNGFIHDLLEGKRKKGSVAITVYEKASVSEPLSMYSWPGGRVALLKRKPMNIFPVNVFDLPNISAPMKFKYGSSFMGDVKVYSDGIGSIGKGFRTTSASILSQDSNAAFIQLKNGKEENGTNKEGSLIFDVDDALADKSKTSWSYTNHKTKISVEGDFSFDGVKVSISAVTLDTRDGYLPISGIFDIEVDNGYCDIQNARKRLPGAKLSIGENGIVELKSNLSVFESNKDKDGSVLYSYSFTSPATIVNNGTLKINKGFDGKIVSESETGRVLTGSSYASISDCNDRDSSDNYPSFEFFGGAYRPQAYQRYQVDGTSSYLLKEKSNASLNKTYQSKIRADGSFGWDSGDYKSYPIIIDKNGNETATDNNGQLYVDNFGLGTELSNLISNNPDRTFDGFYFDRNCTVPLGESGGGKSIVTISDLANHLSNNKITIFAKWVSVYTIEWKYRDYSSDHLSEYKEIDKTTVLKKDDIGLTYNLNPDSKLTLSPDYYFTYSKPVSSSFVCFYCPVKGIQFKRFDSTGNLVEIIDITEANLNNLTNWATIEWGLGDRILIEVQYALIQQNSINLSIDGPDNIGFDSVGKFIVKSRSSNFTFSWFDEKQIVLVNKWTYYSSNYLNNNKLTFSIVDSQDEIAIEAKNSNKDHSLRVNKNSKEDNVTMSLSYDSFLICETKKTFTHSEEY